ncbi:MAG: hypothetical protein IPK33_06130 [Gemmatimonadetes bacterium]|jgi:hypothetical protein|nr:hypothetical protein [Gemmatimonadota bacterium]MBK7831769.1 hypothetical protein [Gemmatimonadota bacterium]MBK8057453.1 hypothetical protein [Gemmatimonadota bacterium]MBK8647567.1 hypothetical protein [Gemmatimonadota bacterium]
MDPVTRERLQALYQRAMASGTTSRGEHATPEALLAVVERRGSDDDRLLTMDHVMGCASCREGFDLLRAVHDAEPQRARPARPAWTSMALAASLLLAVGISAVRWRTASGPDVETMRGSVALPTAIAPTDVVPADSARTFVWHAVAGALRYDLELLRADGGLLHSAATSDTTYALPMTVALGAGTQYQWLVSAELPGAQHAVAPGVVFTIR